MMKALMVPVFLFVVFAWSNAAGATDPVVTDQNDVRLVPVSDVVPIATILDAYGTSSSDK